MLAANAPPRVASYSPEKSFLAALELALVDVSAETPRRSDVSAETPRAVDVSAETPRAFDVSAETPRAFDVSAETPRAVVVSAETPRRFDVSAETPRTRADALMVLVESFWIVDAAGAEACGARDRS